MLKVENISFTYPDKHVALDKVSFSVDKGEKVFFHGANGAGKTTLFRCLNGLLKKGSGEIYIGGVKTDKPKELMKKIGIVFQNAKDQIICGSVYDEIAFGLLNMRLDTEEIKRRIEKALDMMGIKHLRQRPPHLLSYGQMKRVTIASVLAMGQDIIIFDEPTAGLDARQCLELAEIFKNLTAEGKTILVSTHESDFSFLCADKIIVLNDGVKIADGRPEDIFADEDILRSSSLVKPVVLEVYQSLKRQGKNAGDKVPRSRQDLIKLMESI